MDKPRKSNFRYPLIAERLFDKALLMHPRKLRTIVGAIGPDLGLGPYLSADILAMADDGFLSTPAPVLNAGEYAIAIIPVHGTLVQRATGMDAMSGLTSYESLRGDLQAAVDDPNVSAILLDIDSGGGEVAGCFDLVDDIAAAREQKPVYAFANESAYSAAYAIASAAEKLYMPRTGGVGSIGVVAVHVDQSAMDQQDGLTYTPIYAGDRKIDGWPHGPLSAEAKAEFQKSVNLAYEIFTQTVADNRGLTQDAVKATQAACFDAQDAVALGLADGIASFDEVLSMMAAEIEDENSYFPEPANTRQGGGKAFSGPSGDHSATKGPLDMKRLLKGKRTDASNPAGDVKEGPADESAAEETAGEQETEAQVEQQAGEQAAEDPGKTAAKNAADVADLCTLYGQSGLAAEFIRKGLSAEDVRQELLSRRNAQEKAKNVTASAIQGGHRGAVKPETNATIEDMKRRFPQKGN